MNAKMTMPDAIRSSDMADALEAYSTFQHGRALCFWLLLLGLLATATAFWIVDSGSLDAVLPFEQLQGPVEGPDVIRFVPPAAVLLTSADIGAADNGADGIGERTTPEPTLPGAGAVPAVPDRRLEDGGPGNAPFAPFAQPRVGPPAGEPTEPMNPAQVGKETLKSLRNLIFYGLRFCGYLVTFTAVIYCLSLLIGMKLQLVGRLGGLADAAKAFFLSLVVMVIVLPWQKMIYPDVAGGVTFDFVELIERYSAQATASLDQRVFYYSRFVGFWALAVVLLIVAQWRSFQAGRAVRAHVAAVSEAGTARGRSSERNSGGDRDRTDDEQPGSVSGNTVGD